MISSITRESFPVFTTSSTLYVLCVNFGAALGGGVVDGASFSLAGGVFAVGKG